jgi:hypothetical protein
MTDPELGVERPSRRLVAAQEIAATERGWSAARSLAMEGLTSQERIARCAVQQAFYELIEIQGVELNDSEAILSLFADNPETANATLARIEMNGAWDTADSFERKLLGMLYDTNYRQSLSLIDRESQEAKRSITIPAGFTREPNFVALRRKRLLMTASHLDGPQAKRRYIEVDKVSTFALDIAKLSELNDPAVDEVRLIVASTMYKAVDWETLQRLHPTVDYSDDAMLDHLLEAGRDIVSGQAPDVADALNDFFRLMAAIERYDMSLEQVYQRAYHTDDPARLQNPRGIEFIERALRERNELLTPAATTYYVHESSQ